MEKLREIKKFENLEIKKFYSGKALENYYHEKRFIKNKIEADTFEINFILDKKKDEKQLMDIVLDQNKIVLLGNPGIGKTKELEVLFKTLWERKNELEIIPFFINIKIFRNSKDFEDLIKYNNWKDFEKLCFIIDGLDEISDPQDFISALDFFLESYNENIKIIISCRTNIYEKYLIKIDDFEYYYLSNLSDLQIINILKNTFEINISFEDLDKYRIFLENPFNLNLFGQFYKKNLSFPQTISEAFELSIDQEMTLLNKEKFIKSELIDEVHATHILTKIAVINELMHQNFIEHEDLYNLIGREDKSLIEKISLIEKSPDSKNFIFRHQNYQEFLSAKYISKLATNEILNVIKITEVNKTVPSLLNTISFLINILEDNKFNFVKGWLLEYEPEVLFLLEEEKIDNNTQKEIFRKYFNNVTVEKTFWFGLDRRFSIKKMAKFADVDYLISVIKENIYQRRIVKSAFDILSYCKPNSDNLNKIKDILNQFIFSKNEYLIDALRTFSYLSLHLQDISLFLKICENFENEESKDVHYQLLFMFKDFDNIDDYFEICKRSLNIECKIKSDNRPTTITWFLENIILKTNNPQNFLEYYKLLFNENNNLKLNDFYNHEFEEKFKEKTLKFVNQNGDFIINIFDIIFDINKYFSVSEEYIINLLIGCNKNDLLFKHIIEKYGITQYTNSPLSLIFGESLIQYFIEKLKNGSIVFQDEYNYEYFRNRLTHNDNISLAIKFENALIENGYSLKEKTLTFEKKDENQKKYKIFCQNNFDILFDDKKIVMEINKFFDENSIEQVNFKILHEIRKKWYKELGYHHLRNSTFDLIQRGLNGDEFLKRKELKEKMLDVNNRLSIIRNQLDNVNSKEFEINEKHIIWIKNECIKLSAIVDFQKNDLVSQNTYEIKEINILKLILYFDNRFNINYSNLFYLRILNHCNLSNLMNDTFNFIKNRIVDLDDFNKKIISNINSDSLNFITLRIHIEYAINNRLSKTYNKIKEVILEKFESVYYEKLVPDFASVLPNEEKIEFLKKCTNTDFKHLQWKAINILKSENLDEFFLIDFAKKYLNEAKIEYNSSALDVLFKFNDQDFLEYFHKSILQAKEYQFSNLKSITGKINYHNNKEYSLLTDIFFIIYKDDFNNSFEFQNARNLFQSFIINQSKNESGYSKIKNILIDIKLTLFEKNALFFYINFLINECELSYYNSLSKSYTFDEAKILIENIKKPKQGIMGVTFNGSNLTFNGNNQFGGENNTQTNNFNSYLANSDVLNTEELLKEFQQLKVENEEWKDIFIEGMKDLLELKEAETDVEVREAKTKLRKIHDAIVDFGKKTNDWKNLIVLPVEFHDKIPKLIELGNGISKLIGF